MPIKPENRARYPSNWKQIRDKILYRAGDKCENCRVPNGERIMRGTGENDGYYIDLDGYVFDADDGIQVGRCRHADFEGTGKWINVVLTIAHLDHQPENCDGMENGGPSLPREKSNLRAWCQRCHLRHDAEHHAKNARETRQSRKAIGDLFEQPSKE